MMGLVAVRMIVREYSLADFDTLPYSVAHRQPPEFNVLRFSYFTPLILIALTTGCASTVEKAQIPAADLTAAQPEPAPLAAPAVSEPAKISGTPPVAVHAPVPAHTVLTDRQVHELVMKLLPGALKDKEGWAGDLQTAFKALQIAPTPEHFCAAIAIIEQESSFQADPVVPNLPAIVRREIAQRSEKYSIPQSVVDWMLSTTSRDGRSYRKRMDTLRTEKELSDLIEEIVALIPVGKKLFTNYNPVHTGGPMQVGVEFAESHARARPYPYPINGNLRNEVFSRRGGIYFGNAMLLDYPAPYTDIVYRFADFNAGRYSSRNAAFQRALSRLSGKTLASDGDLLRYNNGAVAAESSATQNALFSIGKALKMSEAEIQRDLRLEKLSTFSLTPLYARLFALADQTGTQPRVIMPEIDLKSPKFQRKLTTQWYSSRVNGRYKSCLAQGGLATGKRGDKVKAVPR